MPAGTEFKFKTQPWAHQMDGFERFKDSEYFALFADMGTGKSKIAIDIASYKFVTKQIEGVLVIAPNNVHTQWIREQFPTHCSIPWKPWIWKSGKMGRRQWARMLEDFLLIPTPNVLKVLAVNVEAFQSNSVVPTIADFVKNHKVLTIVDEATRIKNRGAKRSKIIHKLNKYGHRAILTGTPTAKSPFDLWSQMEFLKANYFDCNYFVFQHRYGIMMRGVNPSNGGRYTTLIDEKTFNLCKWHIQKRKEENGGALAEDDYEGISVRLSISEKDVRFIEAQERYVKFKNLDRLRETISKDVLSVRKEDCLDLPPKVYEKIFVDMSPDQKRIYDSLKNDFLAQYDDKELTVTNKVSLTTRLMQVTGGFFPFEREQAYIVGSEHMTKMVGDAKPIGDTNAKLEALLEDMEEISDEQRVIIWCHFVPELKAVYHAVGQRYPTGIYYGGSSTAERDRTIADLQAGRIRVLVGNAQTAGFGLNLQVATLQYFFSNTFRTEERLQAEDRSHRAGVRGTVVIKDIVAKGTIDERIFANISAGRDLNDYFKSVSLRELLTDEDEDSVDY
jgi:SNF2 family DNA or RNA helicase